MILLLVAVKDRAIDAFQPVQTVRAKGEAIRAFQDAIANPQNNQLHNHPDDFDLYVVGTYNDENGFIENKVEKIADGKTLKLTKGE